ncbi:MAG TPA: hypothetical protein DCM67_11745 [Propionibacteriaceae bacterium]|nr:hypothetical protein [Propionibacteriaceae bacterium]
MIEIATASATSTAPPSAFYARWIDHQTWPQWDTDTEWVHLDEPVTPGAHGVLKPRGGPKTRFTIAVLNPDKEYTDVSSMPGATLRFQHLAAVSGELTELTAQVTLTGPLARLWAMILGKDFAESVPASLNRLIELVEANV